MTSALIVLQVILTIAIVIVVLLQKSSSIGLGAYSGSNESLFGAKGPANFMAKITMVLGFLFIVNTIALGYLYNTKSSGNKSVLDGVEIPKALPIAPTMPTDNTLPLSSPLLQGTQPALTPDVMPLSVPAEPAQDSTTQGAQ